MGSSIFEPLDESSLHEYKVRRRTATADELLYPQENANENAEEKCEDEGPKKEKRRK